MVAKFSDMLLCGSAVLVWDSLPTDTTFPLTGLGFSVRLVQMEFTTHFGTQYSIYQGKLLACGTL